MSRKLFFLSVVFNLLLLALAIRLALKYREELYQKWIEHSQSADMVMFGDSHTASGEWNSLIDNKSVLRLGWGGFTSHQLRTLVIRSFAYHPRYVFILAGANDPVNLCYNREQTMDNFRYIADTLLSAGIKPVFQKLMYRSNDDFYNAEIDTLNVLLEAYCSDTKLNFLDITRDLNGPEGLLTTLTTDGVHLNREGYIRWSKVINEFLESDSGN